MKYFYVHWLRWGMPMEGIKKNKPKYLKINDETKKVLENGIILLLSVTLYCIHKQIIFQN